MEILTALRLNECNFEQFGTAILPVDDMTPHSISDAELIFNGSNLRYYVMRLRRRPAMLGSMTRHIHATQCLSSADAQPWWLAVASAKLASEQLNHITVQLVNVQPGEAVKLHQGTWHAGPFFLTPTALFFNLELSDTNISDHNSHPLKSKLELNLKMNQQLE
jgi:ureidoglycolate hydrolase